MEEKPNIVQSIHRETAELRGKTALIEGDCAISYARLLDQVSSLANLLAEKKISTGQRIGLRCGDGIDYVIGSLALLELNAAVVPLADTLCESELCETIDRIDVTGILTHNSLPGMTGDEAGESIGNLFRFTPRKSDPAMDQRCNSLGAAFIRFSSGTTGESKGVLISHRSVIERTDAANRGLGISNDDMILWVLGMSHHFVVSILLFLRQGATIIVANKQFPFSVLDAVQNHPITFIYGSPVHYYLLACASVIKPVRLKNVRLAISTSMKMPAEIFDAFAKKFGFTPAEAYGIIEIGLPFINTHPTADSRQSVGKILPDYQLRITNPDTHDVGEVQIRGKGMFDAYCSPWRLRTEVLDDGWFHTGDLGKLDEQGRLTLLGRSKTVIVCAGMKVFPEEVEEVINAVPGIRESLVFGKPHPQYGQMPIAHVVMNGSVQNPVALIESLRAHCCRHLSSYKVPIEFAQVHSLSKTPSGKLARAAAP